MWQHDGPRLVSVLDKVASQHKLLPSTRHKELARALVELSARYNGEERGKLSTNARELLSARLHFSFVRDVPKSALALAELGPLELLPREGRITVLDLGAGLGATSYGVLLCLMQHGFRGAVEITLVDDDEQALAVGRDLLLALAPEGCTLQVFTRVAELTEARSWSGAFDFVLLGQVLSEHARDLGPVARATLHAGLVRALDRLMAPQGTLLVVEPALRARARHLHAVRDLLLDARQLRLVAPCPHTGNCGALIHEDDWCHEDRPVDLPGWLAPLAREAGLRWQGLTFSFLLMRLEPRSVASLLPGKALRVVSDLHVTKGKSAATFCGEPGSWLQLERLDRDAKTNRADAWPALRRGDLVELAEPVRPGRLGAQAVLARVRVPS